MIYYYKLYIINVYYSLDKFIYYTASNTIYGREVTAGKIVCLINLTMIFYSIPYIINVKYLIFMAIIISKENLK